MRTQLVDGLFADLLQVVRFLRVYYTAKTHKLKKTNLLTFCNNLLQQAEIQMRSHGLRQLVDEKSVASCQQTCCKLIVQTCYQQACCKLFKQVVTSLQVTNRNKPEFNRLDAT